MQRLHVHPPGQEFDQGPILHHTLSWLSYSEQGKQESFAAHGFVSFCFVVWGDGYMWIGVGVWMCRCV